MPVTAEPLEPAPRAFSVLVLVRNGRCDVANFIMSLGKPDRRRIQALIRRCADDPQGPLSIRNDEKVKRLDSEIWELKAHSVRILFFLDGPGRMVLTHGFQKKQPKTPTGEIERALRLRAQYLEARP